tara:strand:- start:540 stop:977 length:438 start_codon:yes stop_codon:yes gene_type:complete
MRIISSYLLAVLVAYITGAVFVSQGNIAAVTSMGFEISMEQRFEAMLHDIANMYDIYLMLIALVFLIALPVAELIIRRFPELRLVGYMSAGFVAMVAIHVILKAVLGLSGIAPTRELFGLLAQGIAGALGGFVFHYVNSSLFRAS